jgi:hypothetical protein
MKWLSWFTFSLSDLMAIVSTICFLIGGVCFALSAQAMLQGLRQEVASLDSISQTLNSISCDRDCVFVHGSEDNCYTVIRRLPDESSLDFIKGIDRILAKHITDDTKELEPVAVPPLNL